MPAKSPVAAPSKKTATPSATKTVAKTTAPSRRKPTSKAAPTAGAPDKAQPKVTNKVAPKTTSKATSVRPPVPPVAKPKKPKLVRDSFTIPKDEIAVVDELKLRAGTLGHPIKKSELLRAGLKLLASMADGPLLAALQAIPSIKTGRPKADAAAKPLKKA